MGGDGSTSGEDYNTRLFSRGLRGFLHTGRYRLMARWIAAHRIPCARVLELGCFDGKAIDWLPGRPARYEGFDANWDGGLALARARWAGVPGVAFHEASTADEMALGPADRFDLVLAMETLEHIPERHLDGYLDRLAAQCDGWIYVSVPVEKGPVFAAKWLAKAALFGDAERYTAGEFLWATLGRTERVARSDHKGFDWNDIRRRLAERFEIVAVSGIPFRAWPAALSFGVGILGRARRRPER